MSAQRLLDLGVCDAVICGGVDSLCKLTLNGFSALEAVVERALQPVFGEPQRHQYRRSGGAVPDE